eukprot:TRINITY_DN4714_c0_g1_i2.p1 TRINITY_DN4714_c0_g1~~TRINITY_DN4714_c0_g1_i2.p1  ORF type:complete len:248 (+),score=73.78 TRINITY_DN4714_c0_g1_i2:98-745(+)
MGICCPGGPSIKDDTIAIPLNESLSKQFAHSDIFTKDDVEAILKQIVFTEYNTKLYEKRKLQKQRAQVAKEEVSKKYLELMKDTKKLDKENFAAVEEQVLKKFSINPESYQAAKASLNMKEIEDAVLESLLKTIRETRNKLGITDAIATDLMNSYQQTYDRANFLLNSKPELAMSLSELFQHEFGANYLDIIIADLLYDKYKLLPIEMLAIVEGA